jgi:hypothetical protein
MINSNDSAHDVSAPSSYIVKKCTCENCQERSANEGSVTEYMISNKIVNYERVLIASGTCMIHLIKSFLSAVVRNDSGRVIAYLQRFLNTVSNDKLLIEFMKTSYRSSADARMLSLFAITLFNGKNDSEAGYDVFKAVIQFLEQCYSDEGMSICDIMSFCYPDKQFKPDLMSLRKYVYGVFEYEKGVAAYFDRWLFDAGVLNINCLNELLLMINRLQSGGFSLYLKYAAETDSPREKRQLSRSFKQHIAYKKKRFNTYRKILQREVNRKKQSDLPKLVAEESAGVEALVDFIEGNGASDNGHRGRKQIIKSEELSENSDVLKIKIPYKYDSESDSSDSSDSDSDLSRFDHTLRIKANKRRVNDRLLNQRSTPRESTPLRSVQSQGKCSLKNKSAKNIKENKALGGKKDRPLRINTSGLFLADKTAQGNKGEVQSEKNEVVSQVSTQSYFSPKKTKNGDVVYASPFYPPLFGMTSSEIQQ